MKSPVSDDRKRSIIEGMFSHMFATLTGGVFLMGFALHLGMDELTIGLLASMPFLVTVFQLPTSHLMGKNGKRKQFWYWGVAVSRLMWAPIVVIALMPHMENSLKAAIVLGLIFLSSSFNSVSSVSWLSLMSDLVPDGIRGRFFGTRNMLCGAAGMVVMLAFGNFLDFLKGRSSGLLSLGFAATFLIALLFGVVSLHFIRKISDPEVSHYVNRRSFRENLTVPLKDRNFRHFLLYGFSWSFSVHFAVPFFTLYFLRDLHFGYGFIAALGITSALADLLSMRVWGRISDRVKNKPVIRMAGSIAAFIPLAWVFVRSDSVLIPVLINVVAGSFWAGINLCTNNLLLRISPQENKASFLSLYSAAAGLAATAGPILAGLLLKKMGDAPLALLWWHVLPVQIVFVGSTTLRFLSLRFITRVQEPDEVAVGGQLVRVLRSIRGLNVASGFSSVLHPFMEASKNGFRNGGDIVPPSLRGTEGVKPKV